VESKIHGLFPDSIPSFPWTDLKYNKTQVRAAGILPTFYLGIPSPGRIKVRSAIGTQTAWSLNAKGGLKIDMEMLP